MTAKSFFLVTILLAIFPPFFLNATQAHASLVSIEKSGEVVVNVLSFSDEITLEISENESVEVKESASGNVSKNSKITLARENGKVTLGVAGGGENKSLDVTDYSDEVIEVESRPKVEKVAISLEGGKFLLEQSGVMALTDYEIAIDPVEARITLLAPSGERYLSIMPKQAVDSALRSRLITKLNKSLEVSEEGGQLVYKISGDKVLNILNLFDYSVPVSVNVSAQTAEVIVVDQPKWLGVLSYFLS